MISKQKIERQTETDRDRQTDRQKERQTETDRDRDRETKTETKTDSDRDRERHLFPIVSSLLQTKQHDLTIEKFKNQHKENQKSKMMHTPQTHI